MRLIKQILLKIFCTQCLARNYNYRFILQCNLVIRSQETTIILANLITIIVGFIYPGPINPHCSYDFLCSTISQCRLHKKFISQFRGDLGSDKLCKRGHISPDRIRRMSDSDICIV